MVQTDPRSTVLDPPDLDAATVTELCLLLERIRAAFGAGEPTNALIAEFCARVRCPLTADDLRASAQLGSRELVESLLTQPPVDALLDLPLVAELVTRLRAEQASDSPRQRHIDYWLELLESGTPHPHAAQLVELSLSAEEVAAAVLSYEPPCTEEELWGTARAWARALTEGRAAEARFERAQLELGLELIPSLELTQLLQSPASKQRARFAELGLVEKAAPVSQVHSSVGPVALVAPPESTVRPRAVGRRVAHGKFGSGVVESREQRGEDFLVQVRFDDGQTRRMLERFVEYVED